MFCWRKVAIFNHFSKNCLKISQETLKRDNIPSIRYRIIWSHHVPNVKQHIRLYQGIVETIMPPILVPSSAKHIATQVSVIVKWKKRFFLKAFCLWCHPSLQGTTCSKLATETKEKNKVWKLFKIKNGDTRTMSMASF